jgi:hypothetical protein
MLKHTAYIRIYRHPKHRSWLREYLSVKADRHYDPEIPGVKVPPLEIKDGSWADQFSSVWDRIPTHYETNWYFHHNRRPITLKEYVAKLKKQEARRRTRKLVRKMKEREYTLYE